VGRYRVTRYLTTVTGTGDRRTTASATLPSKTRVVVGANGDEPPSMPERTTLADPDDRPHVEVFERRRPRTVRLELDADERVPRHTHEGTNVVLHLLIQFSGDRGVSPYAVEPSTVVGFAPTGA